MERRFPSTEKLEKYIKFRPTKNIDEILTGILK